MGSTAIFKSIYRIYFCLNGKAPGCGLRVLRPAYEFYLTDEWLYAFDHTRLKKVNSLQKEPAVQKWIAPQFGRQPRSIAGGRTLRVRNPTAEFSRNCAE